MKVKVIKKFIDKYTKKLHKVNEVFECTDERMKEIKKAGSFIEPVPSAKKSDKDTE